MRFAGSPAAMNAMSAISGTGVDYNKLAGMGQQARSAEKQNAMDAQSQLQVARDEAEAMIANAAANASATQAQGNASMFGGIMGGVSSLAGGLGSMGKFSYAGGPGSSGTKMGAGGGVVGGYGTLGPNYGFPVDY